MVPQVLHKWVYQAYNITIAPTIWNKDTEDHKLIKTMKDNAGM